MFHNQVGCVIILQAQCTNTHSYITLNSYVKLMHRKLAEFNDCNLSMNGVIFIFIRVMKLCYHQKEYCIGLVTFNPHTWKIYSEISQYTRRDTDNLWTGYQVCIIRDPVGDIVEVIDNSETTRICECECHNSMYKLVGRMQAAINQ